MIRTKPTVAVLALSSYLAVACSSDGSPDDERSTGVEEPTGSGGGLDESSGSGGVSSSSGGSESNSGGGPANSGGASSSSGGASSSSGGALSNSGGAGSGGGGNASGGGDSGSGGALDTGSGGSDGTDAVMSAGCSKERTLQNGTIMISSGGAMRNYILRVPDSYDNAHPYRLVFAFAESGASAQSVADRNYFTLATLDSEDTIFVAPDAANGAGSWSSSDLELTDAILMELEDDLCIDTTRLFATGFSFGGAMSLAIACQRADVFRGVAFFSGADLTGSCTSPPTTPIPYYASQASGDSSGDPAPMSGRIKQAQFAEVNGCTPEPDATTFPAPGQPHSCTEYKDCLEGYPTKYCVFDGPHGWEPKDPGESMSWNAPLAWEFITQF